MDGRFWIFGYRAIAACDSGLQTVAAAKLVLPATRFGGVVGGRSRGVGVGAFVVLENIKCVRRE